jgi:hypothetical protein
MTTRFVLIGFLFFASAVSAQVTSVDPGLTRYIEVGANGTGPPRQYFPPDQYIGPPEGLLHQAGTTPDGQAEGNAGIGFSAFANNGVGLIAHTGNLVQTEVFEAGTAFGEAHYDVNFNVGATPYWYELNYSIDAWAMFMNSSQAGHDGTDNATATAVFNFETPRRPIHVQTQLTIFNSGSPVFWPDLGLWVLISDESSPALKWVGGLAPGGYSISANASTSGTGYGPATTYGRVKTRAGSGFDLATYPGTLINLGVYSELAGVSIPDGFEGRLPASQGQYQTLRVNDLDIATTGRLDITDNRVIIDYSATTPLGLPTQPNTIAGQIASGYAGGSWTGTGVVTTGAAANIGVGYAESLAIFATGSGTFGGKQVDSTSILIRQTLYGDVDLDGDVDIGDSSILSSNFGLTGAVWSQGDVNYDGVVSIGDYSLLAGNYNQSLGLGWRPVVPEPSTALLIFGLLAFAQSRASRSVAG